MWLDEGVDSGGEKYLEVRRRLIAYFARKRVRAPEDLADDTLNRVARRLEEETALADTTPARYCYIVAKFVFLEHLREPEHVHMRERPAIPSTERDARDAEHERLLECLDRCLQQLNADERQLIIDYYRGEEQAKIAARRDLAARLGITANALSIRACRIRARLEACVGACAAGK